MISQYFIEPLPVSSQADFDYEAQVVCEDDSELEEMAPSWGSGNV
jgi:hypothetical protein